MAERPGGKEHPLEHVERRRAEDAETDREFTTPARAKAIEGPPGGTAEAENRVPPRVPARTPDEGHAPEDEDALRRQAEAGRDEVGRRGGTGPD
jgi:hypothetical protein